MSQHDMSIVNQGFPAFRADLNDALPALASNNSGATEPSTMFAHQWWVDTSATPNLLKQRNADNDAWITVGSLDQAADTFTLTGGSAGAFTTLSASGTSTLAAVTATTVTASGALSLTGAVDNVISGGSLVVKGDLQAHQTSALTIGTQSSSENRIRSYGADTATPGILTLSQYSSNASVVRAHTFSAAGLLTLGNGLAVTGNISTTEGITFPATQVASADANTLDDYETGVWTPVLTPSTSGTITLNAAVTKGFYTKVGDVYTASCVILVDSISSPVGLLAITGFPFAVKATTTGASGIYADGFASGIGTSVMLEDGYIFGFSGGFRVTNSAPFVQAGSWVKFTTTFHV